jgi:Carboxypeptidase regulatory-like domain
MLQNRRISPNSPLVSLSKRAHLLLLIVIGAVAVAVPMSAQSFTAAGTKTGTILGTVVDTTDDPISAANVILQGPAGDRLTAVTKDDGGFAFDQAPAGVAYQITVTAEGFADWNSSIMVEPGENKTLPEIKLRILAVQRAVTVSYSSKDVAVQQLKAEEQQRILSFIPNTYVVYEPHPEPLTTKMKFHMAYKSLSNPFFFARTAAWAGVAQARDNPSEWHQGAEGYGKRLGAGFADAVTGSLISNAILPSLLHQDPRYFYQGTGTKKSRAFHAMSAPFVCKGDNGAWQPNYSQWGGSLVGYSISTAYYPGSTRTASHVFQTFGIDMGLHVVGSLAQEFILGKFTSRGKH